MNEQERHAIQFRLVKTAEAAMLEMADTIRDETKPADLRMKTFDQFLRLLKELEYPHLQKDVDPKILGFAKSVRTLTLEK